MPLQYRAAVLHAAKTPLVIETVTAAALKPTDVLVRVRAAGLCHTDLEVIEGSLRFPMPIVLGHEAAGIVEEVGLSRARRKEGRSRRIVVESALRPLLLLRSRTCRSFARNISAKVRRRRRSTARAARSLPMAVTFSN